MDIVAIVPARAGSKGLPGKNLRTLAGAPLVTRTIDAAFDSGVFSAIHVTSDDEAVLGLAAARGAVAHRRKASLARDDTPMADVVADMAAQPALADRGPDDAFALLQPTSPLRTAAHIRACVTAFRAGDWTSAVSVCALDHPPQKSLVIREGAAVPLFDAASLQANRQSLEPAYRQNGAIWIVRWDRFLEARAFVVDPAMPFVMDVADSIDIDTEADLSRAQAALAERAG